MIKEFESISPVYLYIKYKNIDKFVDELVGLITVHYS
jgi:hypothetical protein